MRANCKSTGICSTNQVLTKSHTHSRFDGCIPGGVRVRSTNVGFILISLFAFRAPSELPPTLFLFPCRVFKSCFSFSSINHFSCFGKSINCCCRKTETLSSFCFGYVIKPLFTPLFRVDVLPHLVQGISELLDLPQFTSIH